jgi:hypothetical protein
MARYFIAGPPFTYLGASNLGRYIAPENFPWATNVFDTADPKWDLPVGWKPPVIGLKAMDAAAKAALDSVRSAYTPGVQYPGIGVVPINEPIWSP